jgi:hypothetical protein
MHMMLLQLYKKSSHRSSLQSNIKFTTPKKPNQNKTQQMTPRFLPKKSDTENERGSLAATDEPEMRLLWRRRRRRRRKKEEGTLARNRLEQSGWLFIDGFVGQVGSLERGADESVGRPPSIPTPEAQISSSLAWLWWWRG